MRLHKTIAAYRAGRKNNIEHRALIRHFNQIGWGDGVDLFILLVLICSIGIQIVLNYAEQIDGDLISWQSQAIHWHDKALRYENVVVSMLNGQVTLNNRQRTVCLLNAAGDCEKR